MATIKTHTLARPDGLIECNSVIDVGAGIRPFRWYEPEWHICVEPHDPYANRLEENGYTVVRATALDALRQLSAEAVYLLDVIEHMNTETGSRVISLAKEKATVQVVIFTPLGFVRQEADSWNLGGDDWQKHRSGWFPEDFSGWRVQLHRKGFFAIWDA